MESVQSLLDEFLVILASHSWVPAGKMAALELLNEAGQKVNRYAEAWSSDQLDELAHGLVAYLDTVDPQAGGIAALTIGTLIEYGAEPAPLVPALRRGVQRTLDQVVEFFALVDAKTEPQAEGDSVDDSDGGYWVLDRYVNGELARELYGLDPRLPSAHAALEGWCLPLIAALTRDRAALALAQEDGALTRRASELVELGTGFLDELLRTPLNEVYRVLSPGTRHGFEVRVDGVVDTFQLHVLLADCLAREGGAGPAEGLEAVRPHPEVAACMRGEGPQVVEHGCEGTWDLSLWSALSPDGTLPADVPLHQRIWNEGSPTDILEFEGLRTILVAPPTVTRMWSATRVFGALTASVTLERVLTPAEVDGVLLRATVALHEASTEPPVEGCLQLTVGGVNLVAPSEWTKNDSSAEGVSLSLLGPTGMLNVSLLDPGDPLTVERLEEEAAALRERGEVVARELVRLGDAPALKLVLKLPGATVVKYVIDTPEGDEAVVTYAVRDSEPFLAVLAGRESPRG